MPYQICILKSAPCCAIPWSVNCTPTTTPLAGVRLVEVFSTSPDLTQGYQTVECCAGVYTPGGSCCAWTVPPGITQIIVELWGAGGGGGAGSGATCCGTNPGGGAGTYSKRTMTVSAGQVVTICAGAGGAGGYGTCLADTHCCCGQTGGCSFVLINGAGCADSRGGDAGRSLCYWNCGCTFLPAGNVYSVSGGPCGANGTWSGCTSYSPELIGGSSVAASMASSFGFSQAPSIAAGTTFGADNSMFGGNFQCYSYTLWNTGCINSQGVAGPGGINVNPNQPFSAYNTPGTSNYQCATVWNGGDAANQPPPGNFPGGGGASGSQPCCCYYHSPGGHGASGYVRVWW